MKSILAYATLALSTLGYSNAVMAQADPNPALNTPDKLAWMLFIQVNTDAKTAGNNNSLFETWASDGETFTPNPVWPTTPSSMSLRPRALGHESKAAQLPSGTLVPQVVPGGSTGQSEETRRNRSTFDFIVKNRLFVVSGLKAAFAAGTPLSLPEDSIEVKVNWVEVGHLKGFNGFAGSAADAAKLYHVNKASDGKEYALVAMHVISKLVPNWTWATFEHKDNPGRCDVLGCRDSFAAQHAPRERPREHTVKSKPS